MLSVVLLVSTACRFAGAAVVFIMNQAWSILSATTLAGVSGKELCTINMEHLIKQLKQTHKLTAEEYHSLLFAEGIDELLRQEAVAVRQQVFGDTVYTRGLIELTNYCKNDCYYCGIRRSNRALDRYRLTEEQVYECCALGYELGFRTFVLQGGEDPHYTPTRIAAMVRLIKTTYPDCAVTLSLGEYADEDYRLFREAGADRYLLRHETANHAHYNVLHPDSMTLKNRMRCLYTLKELGFQVGCGMMVGSPGQKAEHLVEDLLFIQELQPQMVGIGPFLPHHATPFADQPAGDVALTLRLLSIVRLMLPNVLLPATTALGTADQNGRERGILAGANVVMPNLSPLDVRKKYLLYDNKIATGAEAAESVASLAKNMQEIGYRLVSVRGDAPSEVVK